MDKCRQHHFRCSNKRISVLPPAKKFICRGATPEGTDRFEIRKAQAYSLFFKMIRLHSSIVIIGTSISESIEKAKAVGLEGALWQRVIPFANLPPRVKFASDEMALLLSLDFNLFNNVGPAELRVQPRREPHWRTALLRIGRVSGKNRSNSRSQFRSPANGRRTGPQAHDK
jgi:hypothetical protein